VAGLIVNYAECYQNDAALKAKSLYRNFDNAFQLF